WFVRPTVIETKKPEFKLLREELFGTILTIYTYANAKYDESLELCDSTSHYALTGATLASERGEIHKTEATRADESVKYERRVTEGLNWPLHSSGGLRRIAIQVTTAW